MIIQYLSMVLKWSSPHGFFDCFLKCLSFLFQLFQRNFVYFFIWLKSKFHLETVPLFSFKFLNYIWYVNILSVFYLLLLCIIFSFDTTNKFFEVSLILSRKYTVSDIFKYVFKSILDFTQIYLNLIPFWLDFFVKFH